MAEITRRRQGELLRGMFGILRSHPEGLKVKELLAELESVVPPTEFEKTYYEKNPKERRYEKIARFSTIGPVKAGWLEKDRGLWSLTDEGIQAFEKHEDPEAIMREADRLYRQWKQGQPEPEPEGVPDEATDSATTVEEAEEAAWSEIEEHLTSMNPYDFQQLVAGLLKGMRYHVSWVAPPGPDKGVDIIAQTDPLGIRGPRIKVQVKRQIAKVSVDGIRSFMGVLADGDVGLFVNTGGFTRDSENEARHHQKQRLMLVSLRRLFDLWVEHYDQIPEEYRRLLPLRAVQYLAPGG
jgi:restriction system protein